MMLKPGAAVKFGRALPRPVKLIVKPLWYRLSYGFWPNDQLIDLVGYETLIDYIIAADLLQLPGDVLEIGSFCGGGTYKLAHFMSRAGVHKRLYTLDCFNIAFDRTVCTAGIQMCDLYSRILSGKSQQEVFRQTISGLGNVVPIVGDSMNAVVPAASYCFAFVDGNHSPDYVRNDFSLVWHKLCSKGVAAFHDYGHDLPQVTRTLDDLCKLHQGEIARVSADETKHILFVEKR